MDISVSKEKGEWDAACCMLHLTHFLVWQELSMLQDATKGVRMRCECLVGGDGEALLRFLVGDIQN
jgi:hypothetical protein